VDHVKEFLSGSTASRSASCRTPLHPSGKAVRHLFRVLSARIDAMLGERRSWGR